MHFSKYLAEHRKRNGISLSDASSKTRLTEIELRDIENERVATSDMEQLGILVALGMPVSEATDYVFTPVARSIFDFDLERHAILAQEDPFVFEKDGCLNISERNGSVYSIEQERIDSPEKALRWLRHLSSKGWMKRETIHSLTLHFVEKFALQYDLPSE